MELSIPDHAYISAPPYVVQFSSGSTYVTAPATHDTLSAALQLALLVAAELAREPWQVGVFVTDQRGCLVWGNLINTQRLGPPAAGTAEVFQILHELGGDTLGLLDIELESMIRQEQR